MKLVGIYKTRAVAQRVATARQRKNYEKTGFSDMPEIRYHSEGYAVWSY